MRHAPGLVLLATMAACAGEMPPPPKLQVTSPQRGLMQDTGRVMVTGIALPNVDGDPVARVTVNGVPAQLSADGSFTATVDVRDGETLLETVATTDTGGLATDARAVQAGHRMPVGTRIDRAITTSLSAHAFARLSAAAGPYIKKLDLPALLASMQPIANLGDSIANVNLSITRLAFGDVKISLQPVEGGLKFSAEIDAVDASAKAVYAGALVPDGTTIVGVTASQVTIAGTLVVTPNGTSGFTTTIASPTVHTVGLKLAANDLTGQILTLVNDNLGSTIQTVTTQAAERGIQPLINDALGALGGPKRVVVLGRALDLQASPAAVRFTTAGAQVTMNVAVMLEGSESSPGFVITPNGTPVLSATSGIQVGIADDIVNEMLAEVHALGLLDVHYVHDYGYFDTIDLHLALPPMVSANNGDGMLRLVLGDMIATVRDHGKTVVSAAVNAQVDVEILRGATPQQIALQFGQVHVWVNGITDATETGSEFDISGATAGGIKLQLDSLRQFLITVPVPAVAGVQLENLQMHADSGYIMASGDIH
jgi:hypothetical protein